MDVPGERPRVAIIIPARFASTRYPGKPLAMLRGATGVERSLIERSWQAAMRVEGVVQVVIATDDDRIRSAASAFGAEVIMTSPDCRNGTERCAEAIARLKEPFDIVVNLQGDAPLTPPDVIPALVARLAADPTVMVVTPAVRCSQGLYVHLTSDQAAGRVGGTTVVFGRDGNALYFSKRVIPYLPPDYQPVGDIPVWQHLGVYAYRPAALAHYQAAPPAQIELLEGLEQLRFLDAGVPVAIVEVPQPRWDMIELNNPSDIAPIEAVLKASGIG